MQIEFCIAMMRHLQGRTEWASLQARSFGIDAPELKQAYGVEAKDHP
jgi:hypothetical protein